MPGELTAEIDGAPAAGSADGGALRYDLPANGFASWDVAARAAAGTTSGRYFITARITDELGQVLEDTALKPFLLTRSGVTGYQPEYAADPSGDYPGATPTIWSEGTFFTAYAFRLVGKDQRKPLLFIGGFGQRVLTQMHDQQTGRHGDRETDCDLAGKQYGGRLCPWLAWLRIGNHGRRGCLHCWRQPFDGLLNLVVLLGTWKVWRSSRAGHHDHLGIGPDQLGHDPVVHLVHGSGPLVDVIEGDGWFGQAVDDGWITAAWHPRRDDHGRLTGSGRFSRPAARNR